MPKFVDLTGKRFGRLIVVKHLGRNRSFKQVWGCVCDCGNIHEASSSSLVNRNTTSCGCYLKERITKHGGTGKSSYNTWRAMMRRCFNTEDKDYPRYGGVGVKVCVAWWDYEKFVADMGEPSGKQTLDRKDPYGDYEPDNCRWASLTTQARNIRVSKRSTSGIVGVHAVYGGKWMAKITARKKSYYSKVFYTIEEAAEARKELVKLHWGEDA